MALSEEMKKLMSYTLKRVYVMGYSDAPHVHGFEKFIGDQMVILHLMQDGLCGMQRNEKFDPNNDFDVMVSQMVVELLKCLKLPINYLDDEKIIGAKHTVLSQAIYYEFSDIIKELAKKPGLDINQSYYEYVNWMHPLDLIYNQFSEKLLVERAYQALLARNDIELEGCEWQNLMAAISQNRVNINSFLPTIDLCSTLLRNPKFPRELKVEASITSEQARERGMQLVREYVTPKK